MYISYLVHYGPDIAQIWTIYGLLIIHMWSYMDQNNGACIVRV